MIKKLFLIENVINNIEIIDYYIGVKSYIVNHILVDSRSLTNAHGTIFFAIMTTTGDGHKYIESLYSLGVRSFVIQKNFEYYKNQYPEANWLLVYDTVDSLQGVSKYIRDNTNFKDVIGITGSYGKTIVKEILVTLLKNYNITSSPQSFNSQIGVPLSVFASCKVAKEKNTIAVFEAGISKKGEMCKLQKIINPSIGIFTSIGDEHKEGFESIEDKIEEKLQLFLSSKVIILGSNVTIVKDYIEKKTPYKRIIYWSFDPEEKANYYVKILNQYDGKSELIIRDYNGKEILINIPFVDGSYIIDAINAIITTIILLPNENIGDLPFEDLRRLEMKMDLKTGIRDNTIVHDFYSLDLQSLYLALDFQRRRSNISNNNSVVIISSDIIQSEESIEYTVRYINNFISYYNNVSVLIIIGNLLVRYQNRFFIKNIYFFETVRSLIASKLLDRICNSTILIKGSRLYPLDDIVRYMEQKIHPTSLDVNLKAIKENVDYYRRSLPSEHKIIAMVKANAYGLGAFEISRSLQDIGIDYLAVALADEGKYLRDKGIRGSIIVMNPEEDSFNLLFDYNLEPEVYSFNMLNKLIKIASSRKTKINIHIKLDTGMHRLGFLPNEITQLSSIVMNQSYVIVKSIFSHLSSADDISDTIFTNNQLTTFENLSSILISNINYKPYRHILNTAGIKRFGKTKYAFDMVRLGIGIYGIDPLNENDIKLSMCLKTSIIQIKKVLAGERVGYTNNTILSTDSKIAIIPIGYADGFRRSLGNGNYCVDINGYLCPTLGNICMDTCMIDISNHPNVKEGEKVIIFGSNLTPINYIAKLMGTIPYEVITTIGCRVRRTYYYGDSL